MHSHSLRRILDAARGSQAAVRPQRIVRGTMSRAAAPDADCIPREHFIEEAHAALVPDVILDPVTVY